MSEKKTNQQIAVEVLLGKWGNGYSRIEALTKAGYDATAVQDIVNVLVRDGFIPSENDAKTELGNGTLTIDVDLSKYSSLTLNLHFGDEK